jgi:hypothetical protein
MAWRGFEILPFAILLYGAGYGHSLNNYGKVLKTELRRLAQSE